jgi:hypothetical protein
MDNYKMFFIRPMTALCAVLLFAASMNAVAAAVRSTPVLNQILPRGMQRGTEITLLFQGQRLFGTQECLFYDTGIEVKSIEQVDNNQVKVTVAVSADCRLGEHVAQLRTSTGISDYRNVFVGALEEIKEVEPNSEITSPQKIDTNRTVNGVIQAEDVDYYQIEATKGQRVSVEIEAIRLGFMFDPYIAIQDAKGNELKAVDDCTLTKQDGHFSIVAPEDGNYTIMVREASYGGNNNCRYRLHVGNFPRPALAFPAGGKVGDSVEVQFLGNPSGPIKQTVEVVEENGFRDGIFCRDESGISPSPVPFVVSNLNSVREAEPNNSFAEEKAATLPIAFDGQISEGDPADFHRFTAKKGETWVIDCLARRIGSRLDPVMNVYFAKNKKHIIGNDDFQRKPDSQIRFKVPEDGDYFVRVADHLKRGGDEFVYRLQIEKPKPSLTVGIRRNDRFTQRRQQIVVPQGNRFALLMDASRKDFGGEIKLLANSLPAGITMHCKPMAANMTFMPVVFEAAADAKIDGGLFELKGSHVDDSKNIVGGYRCRADLVLGEPNNTLYYPCYVDKVAAAVVDAVPFKLEMVPPKAPLLQNGSTALTIKIHRDEGFDKDILLQFPFRSPGVGTNYQIRAKKDKTEIKYPLNANSKAQTGKWPMYVIGYADNNGQAWVSTQLAELEIAPPRVKIQMARTSVTRGESAEMACTVEQLIEFEGQATAELLGVPPHVTTNSPLKFDKSTSSLVFKFETTEKAPTGKHRPFVRVTIPYEEEAMVANAGKGELLINKPRPAKKKVAVK